MCQSAKAEFAGTSLPHFWRLQAFHRLTSWKTYPTLRDDAAGRYLKNTQQPVEAQGLGHTRMRRGMLMRALNSFRCSISFSGLYLAYRMPSSAFKDRELSSQPDPIFTGWCAVGHCA